MWTLQLHGITDHLNAEEAYKLEQDVLVKAHSLFAGLVPAGHEGVAGTFDGDHLGPVNLVDAASPPEGTPAPPEGIVADGTPEPAPTEPPPTFVNGAPVEPEQTATEPSSGV